MINYTFTKDDVQFVEKAIEVKNKGWYMDGAQLTQVYNRVLHKNANVTNCGSCIRQRICELETALNHFKRLGELSGFTDVYDYINEVEAINNELSDGVKGKDSVSSVEPTVMKEEASDAVIVQSPQENKPVIKRAGRPKKK